MLGGRCCFWVCYWGCVIACLSGGLELMLCLVMIGDCVVIAGVWVGAFVGGYMITAGGLFNSVVYVSVICNGIWLMVCYFVYCFVGCVACSWYLLCACLFANDCVCGLW